MPILRKVDMETAALISRYMFYIRIPAVKS